MRIKNLNIKNYRSLKNIVIHEFDSTTVFYGLNNAGKSNILSILNIIFMRKPKFSSENFTAVENFYSGMLPDFNNNYFNNSAIEIQFEIVVEINYNEIDIDQSISTIFKDKNDYLFTFKGTISKQEPLAYNYSEIKMTQVLVDSKVIYEYENNTFSFFPTLDKSKNKQSSLNEAFTKLLDVFNDCVYVIPSERDMLDISYLDEKIANLSSTSFKQFLYNLYLSPDKYHQFETIDNTFSKDPFNFGRISFSKDKDALEIMIKENDFRLPIKHLGSGVMQSLFIITSIVCSKSRIICLEELEQNLSPKMQYEILHKIQQLISSHQFDQLILSSHSSVYSKPKLGTVYFIEKLQGETVINKKESKELSKKLKEHLAESQFEYTEKDFKEMQDYLKQVHDFK